jgi:hypothetical protein
VVVHQQDKIQQVEEVEPQHRVVMVEHQKEAQVEQEHQIVLQVQIQHTQAVVEVEKEHQVQQLHKEEMEEQVAVEMVVQEHLELFIVLLPQDLLTQVVVEVVEVITLLVQVKLEVQVSWLRECRQRQE